MSRHRGGRTTVVLFTRDLRVHDHPALAEAAAISERVVPLFVLDDSLLASDYARTLGYWIDSYETRYEDAVRIAGIERARIWKLYLRAARQGFTTGWASIYQVLAHRPAD